MRYAAGYYYFTADIAFEPGRVVAPDVEARVSFDATVERDGLLRQTAVSVDTLAFEVECYRTDLPREGGSCGRYQQEWIAAPAAFLPSLRAALDAQWHDFLEEVAEAA